jgi:hypothetical protein
MTKKTEIGLWPSILICVIFGGFVYFLFSTDSYKNTSSKDKIAEQFHPWDGSHITLEKYIKSTMHDPSSYKHIETRYTNKGSYLIVQTKFRGANKFGALIVNSTTAQISLSGRIIKING